MLGEGEAAKVIVQMMNKLEAIDEDDYLNQTIMISARQQELRRKVVDEEITEGDARVSQNKIVKSIILTLDEMDDDEVLVGEVEVSDDQEVVPVASIDSLDDLKERAKTALELLGFLRKEKGMTFGKAEFIVEKQIEEAEKEMQEVKDRIANFGQ